MRLRPAARLILPAASRRSSTPPPPALPTASSASPSRSFQVSEKEWRAWGEEFIPSPSRETPGLWFRSSELDCNPVGSFCLLLGLTGWVHGVLGAYCSEVVPRPLATTLRKQPPTLPTPRVGHPRSQGEGWATRPTAEG